MASNIGKIDMNKNDTLLKLCEIKGLIKLEFTGLGIVHYKIIGTHIYIFNEDNNIYLLRNESDDGFLCKLKDIKNAVNSNNENESALDALPNREKAKLYKVIDFITK